MNLALRQINRNLLLTPLRTFYLSSIKFTRSVKNSLVWVIGWLDLGSRCCICDHAFDDNAGNLLECQDACTVLDLECGYIMWDWSLEASTRCSVLPQRCNCVETYISNDECGTEGLRLYQLLRGTGCKTILWVFFINHATGENNVISLEKFHDQEREWPKFFGTHKMLSYCKSRSI